MGPSQGAGWLVPSSVRREVRDKDLGGSHGLRPQTQSSVLADLSLQAAEIVRG
jgi:hypothetical protein